MDVGLRQQRTVETKCGPGLADESDSQLISCHESPIHHGLCLNSAVEMGKNPSLRIQTQRRGADNHGLVITRPAGSWSRLHGLVTLSRSSHAGHCPLVTG
jgi:hypothetical protein